MARLRNVQTGAVVSCSEDTAARLGSEWKPIDEAKAEPKPAPKQRKSSK